MSHFVTGATGFIGRRLVRRLLRRGGTVRVLVRPGSRQKFEALRAEWGEDADRVIPIEGDLAATGLGLAAADLERLRGQVTHLFHLGALYDLAADDAELEAANVRGTREVLRFAGEVGAGCLHFVSSIAAAGLYDGVFDETMFDEATGLEHPYFRTKHDAEALVRRKCPVPWRIYRPAMVVGESGSGRMDKIDGPYYLFKAIQKLRRNVPAWFPMLGVEGGWINLVPVDYVADALDHLAHLPGEDGRCFHLVDPRARTFGEVMNVFCRAAHAPTAGLRIDLRLLGLVPDTVRGAVTRTAPVRRIVDQLMQDLGIPRSVLQLIAYPTRFDSRAARALLEPAGIRVPPLEDYAWRLWDYWERHLDPDLLVDRSLSGAVRGRLVLLTGGSSGVGRATARRLAEAGARLVIMARDPAKLEETRAELAALGSEPAIHACDLTDETAVGALAQRLLETHGPVDILINNAGHSIRRSLEISYDRFRDYERLMRVNYLGPVRLTLGLLPAMVAQRRGQVINVSSIGVLSNSPRFSAYVASKAALEAFSRSAGAETCGQGVQFTIVNLPLVRTPMIAPTRLYEHLPTISAEEAAEMIVEAIIHRPVRVATRLGIFAQIVHLVAPRLSQLVMHTGYEMFPDSAAARGTGTDHDPKPSQEGLALTRLLRGLHW
ncbi:MAG: SDR family oxidoreductase [Gammaproteobacteria bacterium]|nr:SDR family oxidoreductase [Gammaproteobacteria bacterium]